MTFDEAVEGLRRFRDSRVLPKEPLLVAILEGDLYGAYSEVRRPEVDTPLVHRLVAEVAVEFPARIVGSRQKVKAWAEGGEFSCPCPLCGAELRGDRKDRKMFLVHHLEEDCTG